MNDAEVRALLGMCASFDNRQPSDAAAAAWTAALRDVPFPDARDAVVQHYTHSREWIMPADIRRLALAARAKRIDRADAESGIPAADPDDVPAYLQALRQGTTRTADQLAPRPVRELLAGGFQSVPVHDALTPEASARRAQHLKETLAMIRAQRARRKPEDPE